MSKQNSLVYIHRYKVNVHDVNADKYLTIPSLLRSMQDCSLLHARVLKTSVWDMEADYISWVLLRKEIKIIEPLQLDDVYTVITYPSGFDKFFAFRDYLVFNEKNKLVATASSTWSLINTDTRKLSKIPSKILEIGTPKDLEFLSQADKINDSPEDWEFVDARKVRPYDLDWNSHINNIVVVRYLLEPYKANVFEDQQIVKLLLHFKNEIEINREVEVLIGKKGASLYTMLKSKEESKIVASCMITIRAKL
jgi:medium-chain acyl-[acyl-carrier-protein] hydrolase